MNKIKIPLRDIEFALFEVLNFEAHYSACCPSLDRDLTKALLSENARFCEDVLAPLCALGDREGCQMADGKVTTPSGFRSAYRQYCEAGWPSLARSEAFGGQGLPQSLGVVINELSATANYAWTMYPGLSQGAMHTIESHGSDWQKQTYLPSLISGEWTGTMCLTEAHCGTDLGLLKTAALPLGDGRYALTGNKIFISSGDHDLADNIIHILLARLPGAPPGTKGLSLFIVPKYLPNADGSLGEHNKVNCVALEQKMGIHGNATCALNFDGAIGSLLGEPNKGLNVMFTFMNLARLGAALQGLAHAEAGFQASLTYSRNRLQGRSLSGVGAETPAKAFDSPADPIICHPDVRRMLLTQKALSEGMRMMAYFAAKRVDIAQHGHTESQRQKAQDMLSVITPIAKGFITELGFESASLALQCFGGHGYIQDYGVEQNLRDCRIASLYEGTTGVQALDLLGRKILLSDGKLMEGFARCIQSFCQDSSNAPELSPYVKSLARLHTEWLGVTQSIGARAQQNPDEVGAAAVDYLMYCGYIFMGYLWACAAKTALAALANATEEEDFYRAKLTTARFYFERLLPRTLTLVATLNSGADNLMQLPADDFAF